MLQDCFGGLWLIETFMQVSYNKVLQIYYELSHSLHLCRLLYKNALNEIMYCFPPPVQCGSRYQLHANNSYLTTPIYRTIVDLFSKIVHHNLTLH